MTGWQKRLGLAAVGLVIVGCRRQPSAHVDPPSTRVAPPTAVPAPLSPPPDLQSEIGPQPIASPAQPPPAREVELVTIKLVVTPPKLAHVIWGVKDLGVAPLELRRPRGSGPMDLILRAPGFLTHHTRVFTDRDDTLSIRLTPENEAASTFGYQTPAEKPSSSAKAKPAR
jgi:hypothetical protein